MKSLLAKRAIFEATHHPPFPTWEDYEKWGIIIRKDGKKPAAPKGYPRKEK